MDIRRHRLLPEHFNPRPPRGGRRDVAARGLHPCLNFNPRPPRGGRLPYGQWGHWLKDISIHAPREGGDRRWGGKEYRHDRRISIHAPREGGDWIAVRICGWYTAISIHAPREGGDGSGGSVSGRNGQFQSTPPARGATRKAESMRRKGQISIHAPREGGDSKDAQFYLRIFDK